jgi:hypothetical protein
MKTTVPVLLLILYAHNAAAQITTPIVKAGFGVDGELRANFFMGIPQSGNDDWFLFPNTFGSGQFVIDTTGAAQIVSNYVSDPNSRKIPFYRTMRVDPYSLINNYRVIDAVFIRDYHGSDSTIFASGSNKNGMSPANWTCPVAQSIPDKNEILDMMVHVRRAGPNSTDSLWMFGGLSIENTVGNRYFDFEMYQTDIYYDRASRRFYGYGPDAGHTSWQFDGAGNITRPGDIVFAAEYSSNVLSNIEARIWIDQASLSINSPSFNWTGSFDGASNGSQYGYAGITPKTTGAFYTGLSSSANTWAGPFSLVLGDNSLVTTYTSGQFMEFSVNLTKLGLDPVTLLGGDDCGMPFRRILVKSRSSVSFTAELKDFVGPYDFFLAPRAEADVDIPYYCGIYGVSELEVDNPVSTSVYTWSTLDGNIVGTTTGPSTTVNAPGTYIVTQQLQSACSIYATDTVVIFYDASCSVLASGLLEIKGFLDGTNAQLKWIASGNEDIKSFEVERSFDSWQYVSVNHVDALPDHGKTSYSVSDNTGKKHTDYVHYRLKIFFRDGHYSYSKIIALKIAENHRPSINISPNPSKTSAQVNIYSLQNCQATLYVYSVDGRVLAKSPIRLQKGNTSVNIGDIITLPEGIFPVKIHAGNTILADKLIMVK